MATRINGLGLAGAVGLMMVLAPASAGTAPALKTYIPPYSHTVSSPYAYESTSGCAKLKNTNAKWSPTTGLITTAHSGSAKTCGRVLGPVGGYSVAYIQAGVQVAFPFTVGSNGNHTISTTWNINIASAWSHTFSTPICPKNVNYNPPLYSYSLSYCEAGTFQTFFVTSSLLDLQNSSWYNFNYSFAEAYNDTYFENYTYCYNYGTPSCTNYTGSSFGGSYEYNAAGLTAWTWNGATSFTLWSNGTGMVKGHHYVLTLNLLSYSDIVADAYNLNAAWSGSASSTINLATLGNGATVKSVQVA